MTTLLLCNRAILALIAPLVRLCLSCQICGPSLGGGRRFPFPHMLVATALAYLVRVVIWGHEGLQAEVRQSSSSFCCFVFVMGLVLEGRELRVSCAT